jgi:regulatory protein
MKITSITPQKKRTNRYSVFIDGVYEFSLSEAALLSSKITTGQELTKEEEGELRLLADSDAVYAQTTRYVAMRLRTSWEVSEYLKRKHASPALTQEILSKLSNIGLIDDKRYAMSYVHDRQLLRPTSNRKMVFELRKKHIPVEIIDKVLTSSDSDTAALKTVIARKREQSRYQDDMKLMQYLARQGFHYGDIKEALASSEPTP